MSLFLSLPSIFGLCPTCPLTHSLIHLTHSQLTGGQKRAGWKGPCAETQLTAPFIFAPCLDTLIRPLGGNDQGSHNCPLAHIQVAASCLIVSGFSWDPLSPIAGWHGARKALPQSPLIPLEDLEPQSPLLTQLVHRWQRLWLAAQDRQHRLQSSQQRLQEVRMGKFRGQRAALEWQSECREGPKSAALPGSPGSPENDGSSLPDAGVGMASWMGN